MPDTEQVDTFAKLALIVKRAREEPACQFISLAHLLNEGFFKACYMKLGRDRACGIDDVTWKEYGEKLDENLNDLVMRLKAKRYQPLPAKRVYIPKNEHEKRPLGLPALEDKIVQKAIVIILEAIYEADFLGSSYGFRPGRSCHKALEVVGHIMMTKPVNHVVEADIKGCFDKIPHDWLMKALEIRIKDSSMLLIIRRFLKAGYMEHGMLVATEQGTPQGGNLSPLLCNIFLHYVLDVWFEKKIKPELEGYAELVRYADDFVCMVQSVQDARKIEQKLKERFARYGMELHYGAHQNGPVCAHLNGAIC